MHTTVNSEEVSHVVIVNSSFMDMHRLIFKEIFYLSRVIGVKVVLAFNLFLNLSISVEQEKS